jgi:hypothetical protein
MSHSGARAKRTERSMRVWRESEDVEQQLSPDTTVCKPTRARGSDVTPERLTLHPTDVFDVEMVEEEAAPELPTAWKAALQRHSGPTTRSNTSTRMGGPHRSADAAGAAHLLADSAQEPMDETPIGGEGAMSPLNEHIEPPPPLDRGGGSSHEEALGSRMLEAMTQPPPLDRGGGSSHEEVLGSRMLEAMAAGDELGPIREAAAAIVGMGDDADLLSLRAEPSPLREAAAAMRRTS